MSFTSQRYKKYFTLYHNGPKNVRTVQMIASIGMEMMPAGADVGYGWVYIKGGAAVHERVLLPCRLLGRRCHKKSCPLFPVSALCGGAWWWMLPRGGLAQWRTFWECSFFRVSVFVLIIMPSVCA